MVAWHQRIVFVDFAVAFGPGVKGAEGTASQATEHLRWISVRVAQQLTKSMTASRVSWGTQVPLRVPQDLFQSPALLLGSTRIPFFEFPCSSHAAARTAKIPGSPRAARTRNAVRAVGRSRPAAAAARTDRLAIGTRPHRDLDPQFRSIPYQLLRAVHKALVPLHVIENSLQVHPGGLRAMMLRNIHLYPDGSQDALSTLLGYAAFAWRNRVGLATRQG
jgi:hypothetical protein